MGCKHNTNVRSARKPASAIRFAALRPARAEFCLASQYGGFVPASFARPRRKTSASHQGSGFARVRRAKRVEFNIERVAGLCVPEAKCVQLPELSGSNHQLQGTRKTRAHFKRNVMRKRNMIRLLAITLFMFACSSTYAESVVIEAEAGTIEQWGSAEVDKDGTFNFSLKLVEIKEVTGKWLPSAHVGIVDDESGAEFTVRLVQTTKGKGIVLGYQYTENMKVIYHKPVLHNVPLEEVIRVEMKINDSGEVLVNTVGLHESFTTKIRNPRGVFGVSGAKAEFFPEDGS